MQNFSSKKKVQTAWRLIGTGSAYLNELKQPYKFIYFVCFVKVLFQKPFAAPQLEVSRKAKKNMTKSSKTSSLHKILTELCPWRHPVSTPIRTFFIVSKTLSNEWLRFIGIECSESWLPNYKSSKINICLSLPLFKRSLSENELSELLILQVWLAHASRDYAFLT